MACRPTYWDSGRVGLCLRGGRLWEWVLSQGFIDAVNPVAPRSRVVRPNRICCGSHCRKHQHEWDNALPLVVLSHEAVGRLIGLLVLTRSSAHI